MGIGPGVVPDHVIVLEQTFSDIYSILHAVAVYQSILRAPSIIAIVLRR